MVLLIYAIVIICVLFVVYYWILTLLAWIVDSVISLFVSPKSQEEIQREFGRKVREDWEKIWSGQFTERRRKARPIWRRISEWSEFNTLT
jgi:hypothetical protein